MNRQTWLLVTTLVAAFAIGPWSGCANPMEDGSDPPQRSTDSVLHERVGTYLAPWVARGDFRGVVRISRGDDVLVNATWGLDGRVEGDPRNAIFRIASITKTITAGAVLMQVEAGRLSLDTKIDRFAPNFESADQITVRHLLAHAAGLSPPDDTLFLREGLVFDELIADIAARPLQFEPGSEHRYSNAGYNLLAHVLEEVTATDYESHLRATIFEPLGMMDIGHYFSAASAPVVDGMRPGPGPSGVRPAASIQFKAAYGSGSLASSAADLQRWGLAVAQERLFSYDGLMWPFGWGKIEAGGMQGLEQTGAMTGVTSSLAVFPDSGVVVVVLNAVEASDWTRWSRDLISLAMGEAIDQPELPSSSGHDVDFPRLAGIYGRQGTTLRIVHGDGLELYRDQWPSGHYLTPLEDGTFLSRATGAFVRFEPDRGPVRQLVQRWGEYEESYERLSEFSVE